MKAPPRSSLRARHFGRARGFENLFLALDGAGSGDHDWLRAAYDHVADLDRCLVGMQGAAGELVRRLDNHGHPSSPVTGQLSRGQEKSRGARPLPMTP